MKHLILTKCGCRCDLCLAYKDNVEKHDQRAVLSDGWYNLRFPYSTGRQLSDSEYGYFVVPYESKERLEKLHATGFDEFSGTNRKQS